ncbi:MAG: hypothetical protein DRN14_01905 [Thermoplasmata archaeon]|nr:MAG: hypothetical protein DRN14_01905 [Thermoplasmata archaeon]
MVRMVIKGSSAFKRTLKEGWKTLMSSRMGKVGFAIIAVFAFMAIFAPVIAPYPANYIAPVTDIFESLEYKFPYLNGSYVGPFLAYTPEMTWVGAAYPNGTLLAFSLSRAFAGEDPFQNGTMLVAEPNADGGRILSYTLKFWYNETGSLRYTEVEVDVSSYNLTLPLNYAAFINPSSEMRVDLMVSFIAVYNNSKVAIMDFLASRKVLSVIDLPQRLEGDTWYVLDTLSSKYYYGSMTAWSKRRHLALGNESRFYIVNFDYTINIFLGTLYVSHASVVEGNLTFAPKGGQLLYNFYSVVNGSFQFTTELVLTDGSTLYAFDSETGNVSWNRTYSIPGVGDLEILNPGQPPKSQDLLAIFVPVRHVNTIGYIVVDPRDGNYTGQSFLKTFKSKPEFLSGPLATSYQLIVGENNKTLGGYYDNVLISVWDGENTQVMVTTSLGYVYGSNLTREWPGWIGSYKGVMGKKGPNAMVAYTAFNMIYHVMEDGSLLQLNATGMSAQKGLKVSVLSYRDPVTHGPKPIDSVYFLESPTGYKKAGQRAMFVIIKMENGELLMRGLKGRYLPPLPPSLKPRPSGNRYIFGTDSQGHDILSQLIWGSRVAFVVGVLAAFGNVMIGTTMGVVSAFYGGRTDMIIMRLTDIMLTIPFLPIILILVAVIGPTIWNIILVIAVLGWAGIAKVIRAQALSLKARPFMDAARVAGASNARLIFVHLFPNVLPFTFLYMTIGVASAILTEASLSFLGLGDPRHVSWGQMLQTLLTSGAVLRAWWWLLPPGLAITLLSMGFYMLGRGFEEMVNPRLRRR